MGWSKELVRLCDLAFVFESGWRAAFLERNCETSFVARLRFRQRIHTTVLRLISSLLHRLRRPPDLSTTLAIQTFLVFLLQHVISTMESSSRAAQLQNAIGTTISGRAQLINAGRDVVFHGPLPTAGTLKFYNPSIPLI